VRDLKVNPLFRASLSREPPFNPKTVAPILLASMSMGRAGPVTFL